MFELCFSLISFRFCKMQNFFFRTPIFDKDRILNYVAKTWNDSPEEVKNLYPKNYIELYKRLCIHMSQWGMSYKLEEVVGCLEEAVIALNPKYSYSPGKLFPRILFWIACRSPKPLVDIFLYILIIHYMKKNWFLQMDKL